MVEISPKVGIQMIGLGWEIKKKYSLFYYFIESERDVENDPHLLWLTRGPGYSALFGFLFEI
ncbi:Serine carboxypeptidase-like 4, partial [Bienertia sinuspersici]